MIIPRIFCTLSTPHLGIKEYSWFGTRLEPLVASVLGRTGHDLFRRSNTDWILQLATDPLYLEPLGSFHRRIAYSNAYGTDAMVPTATAVFLEPTGSLHYACVDDNVDVDVDDGVEPPSTNTTTTTTTDLPFPMVSFETIRQQPSTEAVLSDEAPALSMSQRLDALGWTKVFWDLRRRRRRGESSSTPTTVPTNQNQNQSSCYTSQELMERFCHAKLVDFRHPTAVNGHTMLVANSKNPLYERIHRKGRPIMDYLAQSILDDLEQMEETD
jgi:hypothetical protein